MKRVSLISAIVLMVFFLFGCLPSLHPIYTEDTMVFDEQLIGKWYGDDGIWSFVQNGEKEYELHIIEGDGKQAFFKVHLAQLGDHRFIDLYPGENMDLDNTAEIYSCNLVPAHTFLKIELTEPNLSLGWICLEGVIDEDPNLLKHEKFDDGSILITAKSEDIQHVVLENLEDVTGESEFTLRRYPRIFTEKDIIYDKQLIGHWKTANDEYMDIIQHDDREYDILFSDGLEGHQQCEAILYRFKNQTFLGLYVHPVSEAEEKAGFDLMPDFLIQIERVESELKVRHIDGEMMQEYLEKEIGAIEGVRGTDNVYQRAEF